MKNKKLIYLWLTGIFAIFNGALLKLNGNLNAEIILLCGSLFIFLAIVALIVNNRKKIAKLFQD